MNVQADFLKALVLFFRAVPACLVCLGLGARHSRFQRGWFVVLSLSSLTFSTACLAQTSPPLTSASAVINNKQAAASQTKTATPSKSTWPGLTPLQQQTLQPLALNWNSLSEAQKRKWLEISKNYQSLSPEDQAVMHSRMHEWVSLSPQQRAEARLNFATTKELSKQLTPDEKKAKWQTYQALSSDEKQKLAAKAPTRPVGAATAVVPVSPKKLTAIPPHGKKPETKAAPETALYSAPPLTPAQGDSGLRTPLPAAER